MSKKNISSGGQPPLPSMAGYQFVIVSSLWNREITEKLEVAAFKTLLKHKVKENDIEIRLVPGAFELVFGAKRAIKDITPDAVICLGCIIKGETPHDVYIAQAVAQGIMDLNLLKGVPVIFGVLTTNDFEQALERAGGKMGNKGEDAALAALHMALLNQ